MKYQVIQYPSFTVSGFKYLVKADQAMQEVPFIESYQGDGKQEVWVAIKKI